MYAYLIDLRCCCGCPSDPAAKGATSKCIPMGPHAIRDLPVPSDLQEDAQCVSALACGIHMDPLCPHVLCASKWGNYVFSHDKQSERPHEHIPATIASRMSRFLLGMSTEICHTGHMALPPCASPPCLSDWKAMHAVQSSPHTHP